MTATDYKLVYVMNPDKVYGAAELQQRLPGHRDNIPTALESLIEQNKVEQTEGGYRLTAAGAVAHRLIAHREPRADRRHV